MDKEEEGQLHTPLNEQKERVQTSSPVIRPQMKSPNLMGRRRLSILSHPSSGPSKKYQRVAQTQLGFALTRAESSNHVQEEVTRHTNSASCRLQHSQTSLKFSNAKVTHFNKPSFSFVIISSTKMHVSSVSRPPPPKAGGPFQRDRNPPPKHP